MIVRYQVILAYDGTDFAGFQRQVGRRTVQGVVEEALRCLGWEGKSILASGRTDAGVHAIGQVIAFDLEWRHDLNEMLLALNGHLPRDVSARQVHQVHSTFHPRFDAISRRYRYSLICQPMRHPLLERYSWRIWPETRLDLLQEAARCLSGTHDFAAFGTPPRVKGSTIRTIFQAEWKLEGQSLSFEVTANAFLFHMVRRMVFLQVAIGQSRCGIADLQQCLAEGKWVTSSEKPLPQGIAPAQGLVLVEVVYPSQAEISPTDALVRNDGEK
jgi:tRNA pseudouridine38-40 synthase